MGQWGFEPKQGDGALDLIGPLDRAVEKKVAAHLKRLCEKKMRYPFHRYDRAGAIQSVLENYGAPVPALVVAIEDLKAALADEEWLSSWMERRRLKSTTRRLIRALQDVIRDVPKCRRSDWDDMVARKPGGLLAGRRRGPTP